MKSITWAGLIFLDCLSREAAIRLISEAIDDLAVKYREQPQAAHPALEQDPQPAREIVVPVRLAPPFDQRIGTIEGAGFGVLFVARFYRPVEGLDLVFAGLDAQPGDVVVLR